MKKFILLLVLFLTPHSDLYSKNTETPPKKVSRNKKAYVKFLVGTGLTTAGLGCFVGGILIATRGSYECFKRGNCCGALLSIVFGPMLTMLAFPTGELGLKMAKHGLTNLFKDEEEPKEQQERSHSKKGLSKS